MGKRGPTLLVIEDAHDQAILVGVAARRAHPGLDVRMAHDGREGIAYFEGEPPFDATRPEPDLVILDLIMPDVDGFEVLGWLNQRYQPLPFSVVVLTGSEDPDDIPRARALGATDVRRKPTDLLTLGTVVREIVHEHIGRGEIIAAHLFEMG